MKGKLKISRGKFSNTPRTDGFSKTKKFSIEKKVPLILEKIPLILEIFSIYKNNKVYILFLRLNFTIDLIKSYLLSFSSLFLFLYKHTK